MLPLLPPDWLPWPRSLLALPLAALAFAMQAVPVLGFVLAAVHAEYLPAALLYAGGVGMVLEVLLGRVSRAWLLVPVAGLLLALLPRWLEDGEIGQERDRVAREDQTAMGPGAPGLGILVDRPEVARVLARRYAVAVTYARRDVVSVDFVAFRRPAGTPAGTIATSPLPEEPTGVLAVSTTSSGFQRGWTKGYDLRTTARWPDGSRRSRVGASLSRVGVLAFPLAGCPLGPWMREEPCRIWLARPATRTYGYAPPPDAETEAAAIARLIGLEPLAHGPDEPA